MASEAAFKDALTRFTHDHDSTAVKAGFAEAMRIDPSYAQPRYDLAVLDESESNWDDAITQMQEVQRIENNSSLGKMAATKLAALQQAKALWTTPQGRAKVNYDRGIARSRALIDVGDFDQAIDEATHCIQLDDSRYEAHCAAADALNKLGRFAAAAAHIREAMRIAPANLQETLQKALAEVQTNQDFDAQVKAGDQALSQNDYATAGDRYTSAWKLRPTQEAVGLRGAMMLALAERFTDATTSLETLVKSTHPQVAREAAAQMKMLQTFQSQQQIVQSARAAADQMRQRAGLPADTVAASDTTQQPESHVGQTPFSDSPSRRSTDDR